MGFGKSSRSGSALMVAAGAVLLFSGVGFSQANIYIFSPDVEVTEAPPDDGYGGGVSSGQHYTAFRGDTVYVVWHEGRNFTPPLGTHVFFAKSTDGGQTFGPNLQVDDICCGFNPTMKVDTEGIIYIAYQRFGDIYFSKSTDGGNSFTPSVMVSDDSLSQTVQEWPAMAVNNKEQIYICWVDHRTNPLSVFSAFSYDGGQTFASGVQASVAGVLGDRGDIAADDSGRVYVVWESFQSPDKAPICLSRSDDSGLTYTLRAFVTDLPTEPGIAIGFSPSIAIGQEGLIGVAWQDRRFERYSFRVSISNDYGQTFSPSVRVNDSTELSNLSAGHSPSLIWKNGIFYVAWRDWTPPSDSGYVSHIFFSYSLNGGQSFETTKDVNASDPALFHHRNPTISVNESGKVFVGWMDIRYDPFIQERWHIFGAIGNPNFLKGDLNLDGLVNLVDITMELNAVFLGEPFPAPFEKADSNCDSLLDATDVVLFLNVFYLDMPFPCP